MWSFTVRLFTKASSDSKRNLKRDSRDRVELSGIRDNVDSE
jgi:hypothetical protein